MNNNYSSWKNFETAGKAFARKRANGPRKPLRTLTEMAEEFGVTRHKLALVIRLNDGPQQELRSGRYSQKATWYEPIALRAWWASLPSEKKAQSV